MEMTQIQRDALARARRGDFELADAIELRARIESSLLPGDVVAGYRTHRLTALAEGELEYDRCVSCQGAGDYTCSDCDGAELIACAVCSVEGTPSGKVSGPLGALVECPKCAGTLEVECDTCAGGLVTCFDCDGEGDAPGEPQIRRVVDLNGRELWSEESEGGGQDNPEPGELVGLAWAEAVIRKYNEADAEGAATTTEEAA